MEEPEIWIVSTKSKALENCPHNGDGSDYFFVDCLLPASNKDEALAPIKSALADELLELECVTRCEVFNIDTYDGNEFEIEEVKIAAQKAQESQTLTFSVFVSSEAKLMDEE